MVPVGNSVPQSSVGAVVSSSPRAYCIVPPVAEPSTFTSVFAVLSYIKPVSAVTVAVIAGVASTASGTIIAASAVGVPETVTTVSLVLVAVIPLLEMSSNIGNLYPSDAV